MKTEQEIEQMAIAEFPTIEGDLTTYTPLARSIFIKGFQTCQELHEKEIAELNRRVIYWNEMHNDLIIELNQELQESDAKTEINDLVMDKYITDYISRLPEKWTTQLDMYLAMKNAMIESLSYPNKYTEPQPPTIQTI